MKEEDLKKKITGAEDIIGERKGVHTELALGQLGKVAEACGMVISPVGIREHLRRLVKIAKDGNLNAIYPNGHSFSIQMYDPERGLWEVGTTYTVIVEEKAL